jgi:hypothetical protein
VAYGQSIADEKTDFRPDSCTLPGALSFSYRSQGSAAGGGRLAQQSPRATDNRTTSPTPTRHLRRFHGPLSRHRIAREWVWMWCLRKHPRRDSSARCYSLLLWTMVHTYMCAREPGRSCHDTLTLIESMALLDGDGIMLLWDRSGACYEQIIQPSRVRRCRTTARGPGTGDRSIGSRTDGDGTAQPNRVNGVDHGNFCSYSRWSCSSLCVLWTLLLRSHAGSINGTKGFGEALLGMHSGKTRPILSL